MDIKEIRRLIRLIEDSAIEEFEMEREGVRIRVKKPLAFPTPAVSPVVPEPSTELSPAASPTSESDASSGDPTHHLFEAPIVGTFYVTPKPDVEPFVTQGSRVTKGTVLCIIEAMKIFNQIESDVDGEIVDILVENGQPVEYGQPLFEIRLTT